MSAPGDVFHQPAELSWENYMASEYPQAQLRILNPGEGMPARRARLVVTLRGEGIADETVLSVMGAIPRERFIPPEYRDLAYLNVAVPIGDGQVISSPLSVARQTVALGVRPDDVALEVGTGCGYQAALLARLCRHVCTVERHAALFARRRNAARGPEYSQCEFPS
jgi:protein-L-isoaspartate(D-aspartate) O-methyltransferase